MLLVMQDRADTGTRRVSQAGTSSFCYFTKAQLEPRTGLVQNYAGSFNDGSHGDQVVPRV